MYNQKTVFVNYCKRNPIDIDILNKCQIMPFVSSICHSGNMPYMYYESKLHSYIFRLKDKTVYERIIRRDRRIENISFDYNDECSYFINNHHLKAVLITEHYDEQPLVYMFDEKTKFKLLEIGKDAVIINKDAQEIFPDYCFQWSSKAHTREAITKKSIIPENLKSIINANRVLLSIR